MPLGNTVTGVVQSATQGSILVALDRIDSVSPIDPTLETWIIIHGRDASSTTSYILNLGQAVDASSGAAQVLTLDWSDGADAFAFLGEAFIEPVAAWAAELLTANGFASLAINLIGHSWGAVLAAELAEAMGGDVNGLIALDPAEDATLFQGGTNYDTDNVNFSADSQFSWAFYSKDGGPLLNLINVGNEESPTTADEAFVVENSDHFALVTLFANMLGSPTSDVGQFFQLSDISSSNPGPWLYDRFNYNGDEVIGAGYEAVISTSNNGTVAQFIEYLPNLEPAVIATYEELFGFAPFPSQIPNLLAFANNQFAYAHQIGVMDEFIFVHEALGLALCEGASLFRNTFGPTAVAGDDAFALSAYEDVFGFSPGQPQVEHFVDQVHYFETIYAASGAYGADVARIELLARGAVFGQMVGISAELDFA